MGFRCPQRRLHNLSSQLVSILCQLPSKEVFSYSRLLTGLHATRQASFLLLFTNKLHLKSLGHFVPSLKSLKALGILFDSFQTHSLRVPKHLSLSQFWDKTRMYIISNKNPWCLSWIKLCVTDNMVNELLLQLCSAAENWLLFYHFYSCLNICRLSGGRIFFEQKMFCCASNHKPKLSTSSSHSSSSPSSLPWTGF